MGKSLLLNRKIRSGSASNDGMTGGKKQGICYNMFKE